MSITNRMGIGWLIAAAIILAMYQATGNANWLGILVYFSVVYLIAPKEEYGS